MRNAFLTQEMIGLFQKDGYIVVPDLLSEEENGLLRAVAALDHAQAASRTSRADGEGGAVELVVSNELPQDSICSMIVQSRPLVEAMETLLQDEVYHYHNKMILKEPLIGGAWTWHQDYGYWYNNGCLFPHMASCMFAVDHATRENGCLQVIQGSHHMGRVDHIRRGDQTGADLERVEEALRKLPLVYVEMPPGSAVIFHGNTLHRSDQNRSTKPRWAFICCYNTKTNSPFRTGKHPQYSPLQRVDSKEILRVGKDQLKRLQHGLSVQS
ncbi:MAG: phytanoyl-CoA dioxygenase family protein [Planctomyces sp.]